jgi:hypothetical protein
MSYRGQLNGTAVLQRSTTTTNSQYEVVRTWATVTGEGDSGTIRISLQPRTGRVGTRGGHAQAFGEELDFDAIAFVEGDVDIRPEDNNGHGDRLLVTPFTYKVVGVADVTTRGKVKRVLLKRNA